MIRSLAALMLLALTALPVSAQEAEPPMTLDRMAEIILALDPEAQSDGTRFQFTVEDVPVVVITDPTADRMRAIVPIRSADGIDPAEMIRMMQANFDSALDARYSLAQGRLWAAYIHPLSPLEKNQFISGVGQAVNLARTYGSLYTGGGLSFQGGDSGDLNRALIESLLEKGEKI
ncbi:MAG: type III secretion system chaperone [Pseudomonadota bacterium]